MASEPNSGTKSPTTEVYPTVSLTAPNSGMRTDFINNAAVFCVDRDIPASCEVILPSHSDTITSEALVENYLANASHGRLPACSSAASPAHAHHVPSPVPAQSQSTDTVPDFRAFFEQMKTMMAMCRPMTETRDDPQTIQREVHTTDNFSNALDALIQDTGVSNSGCSDINNDDNDDVDKDLLSELSAYFDKEEKTSPAICEKLARTVLDGFLSHVPKERRDKLLQTYARPSNCLSLKAPRINPALWQHMKRPARDTDLQLQIMQNTAVTATYPLLRLMDNLVNATTTRQPVFGANLQECLKLAVDVFKTLQLLFSDITKRRRASIRPSLPVAYKALCSEDVPVTGFLFGDDLDKRFKELKEVDNMSKALQGPRALHKHRPSPSYNNYRQRRPSNRFEPYARGRGSGYRQTRGGGPRGNSQSTSNPFLGQRKPTKPTAFRKGQ